MKKIISLLTVCSLFLPCLPVSAEEAAMEEPVMLQDVATEDTSPYTFYMVPERTYVSAEEVQEGDVHIRTRVYIKGSRNLPNGITSAGISYTQNSGYLYFDNSANILETAADPFQHSYSGGSFISEYAMPTCFGEITATGVYAPYNCSSLPSSQFCDPISGASIRSDGNGGLYFTRSYRKIDETTGEIIQVKNEKVEIPAEELQTNADGTISFTYQYYEQSQESNFALRTITCTIPNYDTTLPADTVLDGYHNAYSWFLTGNEAQDGVSFLGYTDEFPFFSFDIVIKQNTPDDVYAISFSESNCRIRTSAGKYLPLQFVGTSITVGAASATITNDPSNLNTICAFAENDQPLTLSQFSNATITGRVTYNDNSMKNGNLQTALTAGTSPAALYTAAESDYTIQTVPFYCGSDAVPVYHSNAAPYTKKVMVGKKGDANLDGIVGVEDAVSVLTYYAQTSAGLPATLNENFNSDQETLAFFLADIDTCSQNQGEDGSSLSVEDAVQILTHYAQNSAQLSPIWDTRW